MGESIEENDHGIGGAVYAATPGKDGQPTWTPSLDCICGETFFGDSWEEVGAALDDHLANIEPAAEVDGG